MHKKKRRKKIWEWIIKQKYKNREEIANRNGNIKKEILKKIPNEIRTSIITQIKETAREVQQQLPYMLTGETVTHRTGITGKICQKNNKYVELRTEQGKKWYKKIHCTTEEQKQENKKIERNKTGKVEGLKRVQYFRESMEYLETNNAVNKTLMAVSDGSVRDGTQGGTWAWSIIDYDEQGNLIPIGIIGKGRERASLLITQPTHSYRMEALGLLSLMTFARYDLKWEGGIELHMDNKGVIQTYAKCNKWSQPQWVK